MVWGSCFHISCSQCKVIARWHGTHCESSKLLGVLIDKSQVLKLLWFQKVLLVLGQSFCDDSLFLVSSQTFWFFSNGVKFDCFLLAILVLANSWATNASSLSLIIHFIFSSIDRYLVWENVTATEIGLSPCINSNGVWIRSACLLLLCVNSNVLSNLLGVTCNILPNMLWFHGLLILWLHLLVGDRRLWD